MFLVVPHGNAANRFRMSKFESLSAASRYNSKGLRLDMSTTSRASMVCDPIASLTSSIYLPSRLGKVKDTFGKEVGPSKGQGEKKRRFVHFVGQPISNYRGRAYSVPH